MTILDELLLNLPIEVGRRDEHAEVAIYLFKVGAALRAGEPDCEGAIVVLERAARLSSPHSDMRAVALHGAATCRLELGDTATACPMLAEALAITQEGGGTQPYNVAVAHVSLGECLEARGDKAGARRQWREARRLFASIPLATAELEAIDEMLRRL